MSFNNIPLSPHDNENSNLLSTLSLFLFLYFLFYFVISLLFSFETLVFIFNSIDIVFSIGFLFYLIMSIINVNGFFIMAKRIWNSIKPLYTEITNLIYILFYFVAFNIVLFLFRNKLAISKPIIVSFIEAMFYMLIFTIIIVITLQYSFNVPVFDIIDKELTVSSPFPNTTPPKSKSQKEMTTPPTKCVNINEFKDPQSIYSFYDLQVNNYKKMKEEYDIKNPTPPSLFEKVDNSLKYWHDNSMNIIQSPPFV